MTESAAPRVPVTLHVVMFIQGHHSNHSTEFILTKRGGDPKQAKDVIARITYPVHGVQRDFINQVAEKDMDTFLIGGLTVHEPHGWTDHVSYDGWRR